MRARYIYEELGFERTGDVKKGLSIGSYSTPERMIKKIVKDHAIEHDVEYDIYESEDFLDVTISKHGYDFYFSIHKDETIFEVGITEGDVVMESYHYEDLEDALDRYDKLIKTYLDGNR